MRAVLWSSLFALAGALGAQAVCLDTLTSGEMTASLMGEQQWTTVTVIEEPDYTLTIRETETIGYYRLSNGATLVMVCDQELSV